MDTKDKVLEQINSENLKPRSSLYFALTKFLNYGILSLGVVLVISVLSLVILNILEAGSLAWLILIPITIFVLTALLVFAFVLLRATKSDDFYMYSRYKFAGFLCGLIVAGALVWNVTGTAKSYDIALQNNKEYCQTMKKATYIKWSSPKDGYLAGEVQEKPVSPRTFMLKDLRRNIWEIHPVESLDITFVDEGELVKMRGEIIDPTIFRANEIHLWEGKMWFDILD